MSRIEKLKSMLDELSLDAFYVTHIPNIRYLSNFSGSSASVLITKKKDYFITDFRYKNQSTEEVSGFNIIINYNGIGELKNIFINEKLKAVGFESNHLLHKDYEAIKTASPEVKFKPLIEKVENLTVQKTADEISKIKKAIEITDKTFEKILGFIRPGISELDISAEITYTQKKLGALKDAFEPIVASGWRGALPHGIASDKKIAKGEMVTLDFGCVHEGFCSDMTRTIAVGEPPEELKKIYNIVLDAQLKSLVSAKSNISSKALDLVARDYITKKGYGDNFGHGLGHGLGIEVHEMPGISQRADYTLRENSVVTIEPGIYIESLGGVRIEDDVLLHENGCEVMNKSDKELIIL